MTTARKPFSEYHQQAYELLQQLKALKDEVLVYQTVPHDPSIFTFVASLRTTDSDGISIVYEVTVNEEKIRLIDDLPVEVLAAYGMFVKYVEDWKNGGVLHELLRHDD